MPTVGIHEEMFTRMVNSVARVSGAPHHRRAFVPFVLERSPAELRAYIEGADPVTGRPFMQEVLEALTRPLPSDSEQTSTFERSTPRLLEPDTEENLHRLFERNLWTDFLPIVLPTEERVAAMLAGTSHAPDDVIGTLRPANFREPWEFTVEKVAVNAVMAGARPEYFPVILGLAASAGRGGYGGAGGGARLSSISSLAGMAVVNGPIRDEIGMNYGIGALGPYNHANSTIGRAYGLLSQNLQGGSVPGENYAGSTGNNLSYNNLTFAENEARSPWEPLHTRRGFGRDDSTVSVGVIVGGFTRTFGLREKTWHEKFRDMLSAMEPMGATLLLDPLAARDLAERAGLKTAGEVIDWVYENAQMRAEKYWDHFVAELFWVPLAESGVEPFATMAKADPDEMIPLFQRENIEVVVAGGETNATVTIVNGNCAKTVSVDEWR